jgi:hypothetical protein
MIIGSEGGFQKTALFSNMVFSFAYLRVVLNLSCSVTMDLALGSQTRFR